MAKKQIKYKELVSFFQEESNFHLGRVKCISLFIVAILKVQTVNFSRISEAFDNQVQLGSNLRRIQRFFAEVSFPMALVAPILFKLLPADLKEYHLSLDRTNWKFGSLNINILVLGINYEGLCFPILWRFLGNKRGNSSQSERQELLAQYLELFGVEHIDSLSADREFIGQEWIAFLASHKIPFYIRLRKNLELYIPGKGYVKAFWLVNSMKKDHLYQKQKIVKLANTWGYYSAVKFINRNGKLDYLIIFSYQLDQKVLEIYQHRWQIEHFFKALKSSGFNIEDTHLKAYKRLHKLMVLLAFAFYWAYKVGDYKNKNIRKIKIKKHRRRAQSVFKYGLQAIAQALFLNMKKEINKFTKVFLSCT